LKNLTQYVKLDNDKVEIKYQVFIVCKVKTTH